MGNGANCEILNLENVEVLYQIWMKIMKCFTVVVLTLSIIQYYWKYNQAVLNFCFKIEIHFCLLQFSPLEAGRATVGTQPCFSSWQIYSKLISFFEDQSFNKDSEWVPLPNLKSLTYFVLGKGSFTVIFNSVLQSELLTEAPLIEKWNTEL